MNSTIRLFQSFAVGAISSLTLACTISNHSGKRFSGESGGAGYAGSTEKGAGGSDSTARGGGATGGAFPSATGTSGTGGALTGAGGNGTSSGGTSSGGRDAGLGGIVNTATTGGANSAGGSAGAAATSGGAAAMGGANVTNSGGRSASMGGASMGGASTGGASMGGASMGGASMGGASTGEGDGCGRELLQNPGFEQGSANWLLTSDFPGIQAIVAASDSGLKAEGVAPREGNYLAWLGGIPDNQFESYYVGLTQVVHIPQAASSLTLTGFIRIKTQEPDPKDTFDRGYIQLEWPDDRPDLLWLPVEWTVDKANADWAPFSFVKMDTAQIAGKDVMIRLQAETDPSLETSFWLDSLSLVAKCGR